MQCDNFAKDEKRKSGRGPRESELLRLWGPTRPRQRPQTTRARRKARALEAFGDPTKDQPQPVLLPQLEHV
jgi:hypothetical protein